MARNPRVFQRFPNSDSKKRRHGPDPHSHKKTKDTDLQEFPVRISWLRLTGNSRHGPDRRYGPDRRHGADPHLHKKLKDANLQKFPERVSWLRLTENSRHGPDRRYGPDRRHGPPPHR